MSGQSLSSFTYNGNAKVSLAGQWRPRHIPPLENARLRAENDRLQKLAYVDDLTGLFNCRGFYNEGERLLSLLRREKFSSEGSKGNQAIYILADLDGFKEINDTYGHSAGDQVLKNIANLLTNRARAGDVVGRIGGDEFSILARVKNEEDAQKLVAALQKILDGNLVTVTPEERVRATATIGYSAIDIDNSDPLEQAKNRADSDMYTHKKTRYPDREPR